MHDEGGSGIKNCPKLRDVIYGRPLTRNFTVLNNIRFKIELVTILILARWFSKCWCAQERQPAILLVANERVGSRQSQTTAIMLQCVSSQSNKEITVTSSQNIAVFRSTWPFQVKQNIYSNVASSKHFIMAKFATIRTCLNKMKSKMNYYF